MRCCSRNPSLQHNPGSAAGACIRHVRLASNKLKAEPYPHLKTSMDAITTLPQPPLTPQVIHNCPNCSHWLPEGTLACPDCHTLTYGDQLESFAAEAQALERTSRFAEAREQWRAALALLPADTTQSHRVTEHILAIDRRLQVENERKARWSKRLGPFAPVLLFLAKAKSAIFLLFKFKFLLSLLLYFGWYVALLGWKLGVGFTVSIFVHEMGHYIALRRRGIRPEMPVFIPFMGAYVRWLDPGIPATERAMVALAGPLYGLGCALFAIAIYFATHSVLFLVLAYFVAWVNLLNLIPFLGLDGARALVALSRLQRAMIAATAGVFFFLTSARNPWEYQNPANHYIFLVIAGFMTWRCFDREAPEEPHTSSLTYFLALLLVLGAVLHMTGLVLPEIAR